MILLSNHTPTFIHDTYRIVSVNAAGAALFRCDPRALIDSDMMELIAMDDMRGLARLRMTVMREDGSDLPSIHYPFRRCDGTIFWGRLQTRNLDDGLFETVLTYESEA